MTEQQTAHTPGPWTATKYPDGSIVVYSPSTDAYEVARIVAAEDEPAPAQVNTTADARLIAAAPDLLEAARLALKEMYGEITEGWDAAQGLMDAIDKATGQ